MRLIDADALVEELNKRIPQSYAVYLFKGFIDEQPTAYSVEKVVAELEEAKGHYGYYGSEECEYVPYDSAIDIVRKGGVESE